MKAGQDAAPPGVARTCAPGRLPGQTLTGYYGPAASGTRPTRKREKPRGAPTGAYYKFSACSARHTPRIGGDGKETGPPPPDPSEGPAERWLFSCPHSLTHREPLRCRPRAGGDP